jgi:hypothetical protein
VSAALARGTIVMPAIVAAISTSFSANVSSPAHPWLRVHARTTPRDNSCY